MTQRGQERPLENLRKLSPLVVIINQAPRCQVYGCKNHPHEKPQPFCRKHLNEKYRLKDKLSGSEPPYTPERWNQYPYVQKVHNCFAYALNILSDTLSKKCKDTDVCNTHQPGEQSKWPPMDEKTCPNLIARILGDDDYEPTDYSEPCRKGKSMVAFIIDTERDYHVLRLDDTGYFSHKGGQGPATDLDAQGYKIADVRQANFNYSDRPDKLNYTHFCGYFCISRSVVHAAVPNGGRRYQKTRRLSSRGQVRQRLQKKPQPQQKNRTRLRQRKTYR